ncbi:MAG: alpha/beta hydrolase, partial [Acidimicrobiales bacterium]
PRTRNTKNPPAVFQATDTSAHAADVTDVMTALGYRRWLAYGVSYGTTIVLELLRAEPPGLAGAVLDSVYPPDIDVDAAVAESADSALVELGAVCAADEACRAINPDLVASLSRLTERLDVEPVEVSLGPGETVLDVPLEVVIDGEALSGQVFRFLYSETRARFVPGLLAGLEEGDPATARWLARVAANLAVASLQSNDDGTYFAVQCADRLPFVTGHRSAASDFAAAIAEPGLETLCEPWNREPSDHRVGTAVSSDLPVLIVGGRFDPITPPAFARSVAENLSAATVAIRDGRAHGVWAGDTCISSLVDDFMADPLRTLDLGCTEEQVAIDWRRPIG